MRSLVATCLVLLAAGVVGAQPAGKWRFGATGRGTARWTEELAGVTYRGGAAFGWAVLSTSPTIWRQAMTHEKVLFVCLHGAAKSVLAAADFERLAKERGLPIATESAGTEPGPEIAPPVLAALKAEGVGMAGRKPRLVTREMAAGATRIVTFGCALGAAAPDGARIEQWEDVPVVSDGLPAARAVIREHLDRLLDGWSAS